MGRRRGGGGSAATFMMDIMTSAIGCLMLVLISCLMLVLITNVTVYFGDPDNMSVGEGASGEFGLTRYVQDTFGDLVPFPMGNKKLSPDYIDIHPDRLVFYPSREVMTIYDLREPGNAFERQLDKFRKNPAYAEEAYIILLIRPYTATIANELRKQIRQAEIKMGFELFPEEKEVDFRSAEEMAGDEEPGRGDAEPAAPESAPVPPAQEP